MLEIKLATSVSFLSPFAWSFSFHVFTLKLCFFAVRSIFCSQQRRESCFQSSQLVCIVWKRDWNYYHSVNFDSMYSLLFLCSFYFLILICLFIAVGLFCTVLSQMCLLFSAVWRTYLTTAQAPCLVVRNAFSLYLSSGVRMYRWKFLFHLVPQLFNPKETHRCLY